MKKQLLLTNARVVLKDEVILGTVKVEEGVIAEVDQGVTSALGVEDMEGDFLIPGLIELHTDNLEKHFTPRPKVRWPSIPAVIAHDAQVAASGITTVFDAVALGDVSDGSMRLQYVNEMIEAITMAQEEHATRSEHFIHLRCEVAYEKVLELFDPFKEHYLLRLVSVMDHSPGQRQFASLDKYREYYQGKYGLDDREIEAFIVKQKAASEQYSAANREEIVDICHEHKIPLASHDDATVEHVEESVGYGMSIAEFPTTHEAAVEARKGGLSVLMGAPNLVRGRSHSGNVSARELAQEGLLDVISSDYFPTSLLQAAFTLFHDTDSFTLPEAVATVSAKPANAVSLSDRGEIAVGKRGDLVRVHEYHRFPLVKEVWRQGRRIY
ncbi:MAG: alpha-D-ribose 1-methylphosphonate 5-triphosphate diphosphatase [Chromatiales bacterium]|nr:alpha-D-ribose 1-methylphosphonate 5-triphosphate diphosphatase [Chromatiales bacterium]